MLVTVSCETMLLFLRSNQGQASGIPHRELAAGIAVGPFTRTHIQPCGSSQPDFINVFEAPGSIQQSGLVMMQRYGR